MEVDAPPQRQQQPWVDKYRPRSVKDVAHQEEVVQTLDKALQGSNLPHLLFYGPPGTGKTSTALAIARQLYGPELSKTRVMELNASDERGIGIVRNKIKGFAANTVAATAAGYPCPPFKIIILDEADSMTADAQNALRRTMELFTRVTRFIFICNYVSRIIEPLASRCAKFRFKPIHQAQMTDRIDHICEQEGVTLQPGAMEVLGKVSNGDLRKAITSLQSAVRLQGLSVGPEALLDVAGAVPEAVTQTIFSACSSGSFAKLQAAVMDSINNGWPAQGILLEFQAAALASEALTDLQRAHICMALALADKALCDGADEQLQLLAALASCQKALKS